MQIMCKDLIADKYVDLRAVKMHHYEAGRPHTVVIRGEDGEEREWALGPRFHLEVKIDWA